VADKEDDDTNELSNQQKLILEQQKLINLLQEERQNFLMEA
jgi:hypothetical protein